MNLTDRDNKIIWHPFTQEKIAKPPIAIKSGKGSYLFDENGKAYLDLISSWWVNLYGHSHPEIAKSIYEQAKNLEHVIFAGFTHEPAVKLCENLKTILPDSLKRFFFSDNGSTAVEIALKMAHQYWHNQGETQRNLFMSFDGGYHGDTFGAMSVGKESKFHNPFNKLMFDIISIPMPYTWQGDVDIQKKEEKALVNLKDQLETKGKFISAIIFEPLVQGAIGMRMYRPEFIYKVINMVREYDILVIYDEVMTGFGRTGTNFAAEQIGLDPDFICISKGITGGFLPLALTVTTEKIYNAFLGDNWNKAFAHGHSYTGNPIACAASIASFKLLTSDVIRKSIQNINKTHIKGLKELSISHKDKIHRIRIRGTIAAFDVNTKDDINEELKSAFLQKGFLIRPLDNTIYLLPPYSIKTNELENTYDAISEVLKNLVF